MRGVKRLVAVSGVLAGGLMIYVGTYLLLVKPDPPEGFGLVVVAPDGSVSPTPRTLPNGIAYHRLLGQLHIDVRVYDPILGLDRRMRPGRWFTTERFTLPPTAVPNQSGSANRSQPVGRETNGPSSTAGSGG